MFMGIRSFFTFPSYPLELDQGPLKFAHIFGKYECKMPSVYKWVVFDKSFEMSHLKSFLNGGLRR